MVSKSSIKWTAPELTPLFLIGVPLDLKAPKYPEVPPPYLLIIPASA